jgi:hypothetical protein
MHTKFAIKLQELLVSLSNKKKEINSGHLENVIFQEGKSQENTTPTIQGASVLDNAFSREHMNLYSITLRGNVAPGNRTTPDKIIQ